MVKVMASAMASAMAPPMAHRMDREYAPLHSTNISNPSPNRHLGDGAVFEPIGLGKC